MPEKCVKICFPNPLMFFGQEDQIRSPGTLLGPQFAVLLRSSFGPAIRVLCSEVQIH